MSEETIPKKVWVIDDEEIVGSFLRNACERFGYRVELFSSPMDVLAKLEKEEAPDAVLSDLIMAGGMSGAEFYEQAGEKLEGSARYIISGTASLVPGTLDKRITVLGKPISLGKLKRFLDGGFGKPVDKVWYVDSEATITCPVVKGLEAEGFNVSTFNQPRHALQYLSTGEVPHAVMSDFYFDAKGMAGTEALFKKEALQGVPMFVATDLSADVLKEHLDIGDDMIVNRNSLNNTDYWHKFTQRLEEALGSAKK